MLLLPNRWWIVFLTTKGIKVSYHNPDFGYANEKDATKAMHKLNRRNEFETKYLASYGVIIQGFFFNRDTPGE